MNLLFKKCPALLVGMLLPFVFSFRAEAVIQFCRRVVAERMGRSPAGLVFEKAAQAVHPAAEALPFVFTSVKHGWHQRAVKEETTGVLLYVRSQQVVVEYAIPEGEEPIVLRIDEDRVEELIEGRGDVNELEAHAILTTFMDTFVVPRLLNFQNAISESLERARDRADHTGGVSTGTGTTTTWWPIRENGRIIGFHYEGSANANFKRMLPAVGGIDWVWLVAEVRLNRGRAEMLLFAGHRKQPTVFTWAAPLSVFYESRGVSVDPVATWSLCIGGDAMMRGELTLAQRARLDLSVVTISRAHLFGRDPRNNFNFLDMKGMTVLLQGSQFHNGNPARVVEQVIREPQSRSNGLVNTELTVEVPAPVGFRAKLNLAHMVPAVDYLMNEGIDPGTMQPFVYVEGDRVVDRKTFEEFEVLSVEADHLNVKPVRAAGESSREPSERFIPAKYHFPIPVDPK